MRNTFILIASLVYSSITCGQTELTPSVVIERLSGNAPRTVVESMYNNGLEWRQFLTGVATGKPAWLRLAIKLKPGTDAGATSQLYLALGEALEHQPQNVLKIAASELELGEICGGPDVDDPRYNSYALSIKAIEHRKAMVMKVNDSILRTIRDVCIRDLEDSKQGIASFYQVGK